jgi:hypothetical protein
MTSAIQSHIEQRVSTNHFDTTRLVYDAQMNKLVRLAMGH